MRTPPVTQVISSSQGSMTGQILLMILYLALILVGAYYATKLMGRMAQRGTVFGGSKGEYRPGAYITLIDRLSVDKEHSVLLIRVNGAYYLLGMAAEQVTLIEKLSELPEDVIQQAQAPAPSAFQSLLNTWRERGKHDAE